MRPRHMCRKNTPNTITARFTWNLWWKLVPVVVVCVLYYVHMLNTMDYDDGGWCYSTKDPDALFDAWLRRPSLWDLWSKITVATGVDDTTTAFNYTWASELIFWPHNRTKFSRLIVRRSSDRRMAHYNCANFVIYLAIIKSLPATVYGTDGRHGVAYWSKPSHELFQSSEEIWKCFPTLHTEIW